MKKLLMMLLATFLLLTACNSNEAKENVEEVEQEQQVEEMESEEIIESPVTDSVEEPIIEAASEEDVEPQEEPTEVQSQILTEDEIKEIIEYNAVGENDQVFSVSLVNNEVKATLELASDNIFPEKDMAVMVYSRLGDELLNHEGWEVLTVTFNGVGTISMNRNESESNGYGSYFPTLAIEGKFTY